MLFRLLTTFILLQGVSFAQIREPAAAGKFYPEGAAELAQKITELLQKDSSGSKTNGRVKMIIVPHAGYNFSGEVAAAVYNQISFQPKRIILIGPSHHVDIANKAVLSKADAFKTSLGEIPIDKEVQAFLLKDSPLFTENDESHNQDHSLEVQLPFIQTVFEKVKIVPILINDENRAEDLARSIMKINDQDTLIVISTDMSHYHPQDIAMKMDQVAIDDILRGDADDLLTKLQKKETYMCGAAAVLTGIHLAKMMGEVTPRKIAQSDSGKTSGDTNSVVGYFGGLYTRPADMQGLIDYAYQVLYDFVNGKDVSDMTLSSAVLDAPQGAFVTLRKKPDPGQKEGELRGCIGHTTAKMPLKKAIRELTIESASKDSRFPPIARDEVESIQIELSLLGSPKKVNSPEAIKFGIHGVILTQGDHSGVFLPEVANQFPSKWEFLEELCTQKAGLPKECYKDPKTNIQVFESKILQ